MHSAILRMYTSVNRCFCIKYYRQVIWGNIEARDFSLQYVLYKVFFFHFSFYFLEYAILLIICSSKVLFTFQF